MFLTWCLFLGLITLAGLWFIVGVLYITCIKLMHITNARLRFYWISNCFCTYWNLLDGTPVGQFLFKVAKLDVIVIFKQIYMENSVVCFPHSRNSYICMGMNGPRSCLLAYTLQIPLGIILMGPKVLIICLYRYIIRQVQTKPVPGRIAKRN